MPGVGDHVLHQQPSEPVSLQRRAQQDGELGAAATRIVVQAHHAEHASAALLDGNKCHGIGRVVMDELVDEAVAHLAHRREKAQAQIFRRHPGEEIGIKSGILRRQRPEQDLCSIAQDDMAFEQFVLPSFQGAAERRARNP